ncbi:MAG TPA: tripartite tricarboxylate transporter substrate binding protein [Ramlibacter sp.]|nr:tripartite tricarboxylate transporter substrate binding protein [Ramlibacter sp.]
MFKTSLAGLVGALALAAAPFSAAQAQEFPSRTITLLVGTLPGGSADFMARIAAEAMGKQLGTRVIVDNRPGANAAVATRAVARAPADGYTLLFNANNMASNLAGMKEPGYVMSDFEVVGGVGYAPFIMMANTSSSKARTLKEFVEYGKANPGKLTYASLGPGSTPMLVANRFNEVSKVGFREIPYKGASQALQDVLGGQVDVYFGLPSGATAGIIKQPHMTAFAITGKTRSEQLPDVPTFAELGYPGVTDVSIGAVWIAAATPKPIVQKLRKALADGLKDPKLQETLKGSGQSPYRGDPQQFYKEMQAFETLYRGDFKKLGLEPQ